jgi:hypothetical protein
LASPEALSASVILDVTESARDEQPCCDQMLIYIKGYSWDNAHFPMLDVGIGITHLAPQLSSRHLVEVRSVGLAFILWGKFGEQPQIRRTQGGSGESVQRYERQHRHGLCLWHMSWVLSVV